MSSSKRRTTEPEPPVICADAVALARTLAAAIVADTTALERTTIEGGKTDKRARGWGMGAVFCEVSTRRGFVHFSANPRGRPGEKLSITRVIHRVVPNISVVART
jgi:hypothetical protein